MSNEENHIDLTLWLEERKLSMQTLADAMGVSRQFVTRMLNRETIPAKRYRQLQLMGVPRELLPKPFEGNSGRPRKQIQLQPDIPL